MTDLPFVVKLAQVVELTVARDVDPDAMIPVDWGTTGAAAIWVEPRRARESEAEVGESSPEVVVGRACGESC